MSVGFGRERWEFNEFFNNSLSEAELPNIANLEASIAAEDDFVEEISEVPLRRMILDRSGVESQFGD